MVLELPYYFVQQWCRQDWAKVFQIAVADSVQSAHSVSLGLAEYRPWWHSAWTLSIEARRVERCADLKMQCANEPRRHSSASSAVAALLLGQFVPCSQKLRLRQHVPLGRAGTARIPRVQISNSWHLTERAPAAVAVDCPALSV